MKKLEISTTATSGSTAGFLVPTTGGTWGGVCPQPVRRRRDVDVRTSVRPVVLMGANGGYDASFAPLQGLPTSAPPIT